jgi:demethyl-4-deoxygadusol synthase
MNDLTRTELDSVLAVHHELCQLYPRNGNGEDMYVSLDRTPVAVGV